jgi:ArsR family transcriptional regulator
MNDISLWGKALADIVRVRIIAALQSGELCVCELVDALEIRQSRLSSHLQILRQAGIVTVRKDGKWSYYALAPGHVPLIEALFRHYARSLASDPRRQRDAMRLRQRLDLRDNGRCVLSFAQLDGSQKGGTRV